MLPGVKPTGKYAEVAFVVIVGFEGLPLTGAGAVAKLRNPSIPDPFFKES